MFHRRGHPAQAHPAAPRQHFWNRGHPAQHPAQHPADMMAYDHSMTGGYLPTGPHSEFRQGAARWEHTQYADNYNPGHATGAPRTKLSHREKNQFATPFGTPGFAAENLLADNPWTHDTLGYDYYDYFADQQVRGPFGVAPGSVVPPSQRPFLGRNGPQTTGNGMPPKRGLGAKLFHKNQAPVASSGNYPRQGYYDNGAWVDTTHTNTGGRKTKASGLNMGYMPPGAQYAHTNLPYSSDGFHEVHEDILPGGGYERFETDVTQTTHQDIVYGGRGTNAQKSTYGNTRNPSMTNTLPMNIPTASSTTTTVVSKTTDGIPLPIGEVLEKRETVVSAENPTTGLPSVVAKNAK